LLLGNDLGSTAVVTLGVENFRRIVVFGHGLGSCCVVCRRNEPDRAKRGNSQRPYL
jgi:hypothetical protein